MPSRDSVVIMAGWETANSMLLQHNTSHMTTTTAPSSNHDDFVSKYMTPSYLSPRDVTTTSSAMSNRLSGLFNPPSPTATSNRLSVSYGSSSMNKRLSASFPSFCTKDNIDQCISYLDQELTTLGFPTLYIPDTSDNSSQSPDVFNLIQMVNCTYELIQRHQRSLRKQEELENKQMRADSDFSNLQASHTRIKDQLEQVQRDNIALEEKERQHTIQHRGLSAKFKNAKEEIYGHTRIKDQLEQVQRDNIALEEKERQHAVQHRGLSAKFKNAKEEIKKLEGILKSRDVQFKHDLKKKEREINKMKERVHQLLTDKNQERRIGMDILNSLQRTDGKRGTWKTGKTGSKHEEEMYRLIITNYEERQKELMLENQVLRESLSNMQKELVDLLNRQGDKSPMSMNSNESDDDDANSVSSSVAEEISTGHFQMPYEMVREGIETNMKQKWRKLKEHIERMEKENKENTRMSSPEDDVIPRGKEEEIESLRKEVSRLKTKVKTYKELAEQQEQVLQSVQDNQVDDTLVSFLRDSHLLDEKESLADEKKLFYQQKASFEKERRSFTEAAIRLGHERRRFEEERSNFLQQQLMMDTSSSSSSNFTSPPLRPARSISKANSPSMHIGGASSSDTSPVGNVANQTTPKSSPQMHRLKTPTTVELYRALKMLPDNGECLNSSRESLHAPSLFSDTDHSGLDSPPHSGTTTPRSSSSRSCASQSSYRSLGQGSNRSRGSGGSRKGDGKGTRRNEEHKQNLRMALAQKSRKNEIGSGKRTGAT